MKKVYAKLAGGKMNFLRPIYKASFIKILSLSSIVALLSSASPLYSKTVASKEGLVISAKSSTVSFPQSVISVYDGYNTDASDQENYVTALKAGGTLAASTVSDYVNFLINTFSGKNSDNAIVNILTAYNNSLPKKEFSAEEQYKRFITSRQFSIPDNSTSQRFAPYDDGGVVNRFASSRDSVATRQGSDSDGNIKIGTPGNIYNIKHSIMIGNNIDYYYNNNVNGFRVDSVIIGNNAGGGGSLNDNNELVAIGFKAFASKRDNVALGAHSYSNIEKNIAGYDPLTNASSKQEDNTWRNTLGAVGIGSQDHKTRRITGVAAGNEDTDAANVAQIKAVREIAKKGWHLSVGEKATDVDADNGLSFSSGSENFTIDSDKNKVTFDLAKSLTLDSIKTGNNTLDATGLVIKDGPKILTSGIEAGNKKITGVAKGTEDTDAVNFSQLKEIKEQVGSGGFVKQDAQTKYITIGKEADGDKIDIANKDGKYRTLSGVKAGTEGNDAVNLTQLKELTKGWKVNTTSQFFEDAIAEGELSIAIGSNASVTKGAHDSIAIGSNASVTKGAHDSIAIGRNASVMKTDDETGVSNAIALGSGATVKASDALAIGSNAKAAGSAIAIGTGAQANANHAFAIGAGAQASVQDGIALGSESVADVGSGVGGYDPRIRKTEAKQDNTWLASLGALSIGNAEKGKTRQIKAVSAGSDDTDAVNVAQLKALQETMDQNWKLSVNGQSATSVNSTSPMDLAAGSNNFTITKGKDDNKVKFDLAKDLVLNSVKAGENTLDATGLVITGGPKITTNGIDAGSKKITGVAKGTEDTDAVNFSQLEEIKEQVASTSFVKQDAQTHIISIGKEANGDKIDVVNKDGENRVLSGIANGTISDTSTEAMTGHQLHQFGSSIAGYLGGGASFNGGTWTAPQFKVKTVNGDGTESEEKVYDNVAAAFEGVGTAITNVQNKITQEIKNEITKVEGDSLVKKGEEDLITIGKEIGGNEINIKNSSGTGRKIVGVSDGTIGASSTEAVNGGQINKIGEDIAKFLGGKSAFSSGAFTKPSYEIHSIRSNGEVGASKAVHHDVGSALGALDNSLGNVNTRITNTINDFNQKITDSSQHIEKDALLWNEGAHAFVARHEKSTEEKGRSVRTQENSKITFLLDGNVSEGSTDAVTGNQLYSMGDKVATYFGGGASFSGGTWVDPKFKVKTVNDDGTESEQNYNDVAAAFEGVGTAITNVQNKITQEIKNEITKVEGDSLVKKGDANLITIGAEIEGNEINIKNSSDTGRKIVGILDGTISKASTEAVNGGQINKIGEDIAQFLGGNATFSGGSFTAPSYTVQDKPYHDIGSAFAGIDSSITTVKNDITNVRNEVTEVKNDLHTEITNQITKIEGDSLVKKGDADLITIGKEISGNEINIKNSDGAGRKIVGILDGTIGASSTEAVNGGQINKIGEDIAKFLGGKSAFSNGGFTEPTYNLSQVTKDGEIKSAEFKNIGSAFTGLDENIKNVNQRIKEVTQGVAQDSLSWSKDYHAFVAKHGEGGQKANSKITFLQAGTVSESSTDAITGSQLYLLGDKVAKYLGGGAKYEDDKWTAPSFTVKAFNTDGTPVETSYNNVADAFAGVSSSFTNIHNEVKNEINNVVSDSLVKWDDATKLIRIGGERDGATISIADKDNKSRTLSGVKDAENDNEAVNKGQLEKSLKKLSKDIQSEDSAVVLYDKKADGETDYSSVTFGKGTDKSSAPVALHNVKDGSLSEGSHDAVNGGQLNVISQDIAKFLGGDAAFKNGVFTGPTYNLSQISKDGKVEEKALKDVGSAFAGLDENIKNVNQRIKDVSESVAQDSLNWSDSDKAFVAKHGKDDARSNSKITSLEAGTVSESSTDAVNGSQLYLMSNQLAQYFGGGAGYKDGKWTAPSFKLKTINSDGTAGEEKSYDNVAAAFADVSSSFTNIKNDITNVVSESLVKQDEKTKVIAIGGEKDGTSISLANSNSADRTLSGVKAAVNDNEAINKGQFDKGLQDLSNSLQSDDSAVVHYDKHKDASINYTSVTFGKGKGSAAVGLHNVADGMIAKDSHDVINGEQINKISQDVAQYFGGSASFKDGSFTQPSYELSNVSEDGQVSTATFNDVGSAFTGLDASVKNVNNHLTNVVQNFDEKIQNITQAVQGDALLWSDSDKAFVAKHGKDDARSNSKITSLEAGTVSESSTDAVNGSQLYSMSNQLAAYLGGGAKYEEGKWTSPTFIVKTFDANGKEGEESYTSVAEAFTGVNSAFISFGNKVTNEITNQVNNAITKVEGDSLVKQNKDSKVIAIGGETDGTSISIANSDGAGRTLSGVKAGALSAGSMEAINGSQLYLMSNQLALYFGGGAGYKDGVWTGPKFEVAQFKSDGSAGDKKGYDNVASAFEGVNGSMTSINERIDNVAQNVSSNSLNWDDKEGAYNAVHADKDSKITHLADGKVGKDSKEAVNGGQLFETNERVSAVEKQVSSIDKQVQDIATATDGAVKYNKDEEGHKTNKISLLGGNESDPVLIDNVANGRIENGSKEAINGGQLHDYTEEQMKIVLDDAKKYTDDKVSSVVNHAVDEAKSYTDMKFETLSYAVEDVRKEARQAAAVGLAVAGLRYNDTPGKLSVSFGTGVWRSQSAFALGAAYTSESGFIRSNLSVTSARGHWGLSAGVNFTLN